MLGSRMECNKDTIKRFASGETEQYGSNEGRAVTFERFLTKMA